MWLMAGWVPHSDTFQVSTFPSIPVTRQCHGLSHHSPAPAVPCAGAFPYPTQCCCYPVGNRNWQDFVHYHCGYLNSQTPVWLRTIPQHLCLCASPAPLMNSLSIRLCLSCQTGLSNETPKVLAHASREDHWPNSYSFEILSVANFHWGKIPLHCESHRNLIKLESANGWLEDHTAVGTRHNPSSTDQPQLSGTGKCCLPEVSDPTPQNSSKRESQVKTLNWRSFVLFKGVSTPPRELQTLVVHL